MIYTVDLDDVKLLDDGRCEVEMWKDDVFEEIDDYDLEEEYNKRGLSSGSDDDDDTPLEANWFLLPKIFSKTQLRDHLTSIAGLGSHTSDSELLEELRRLMYF